MEKNFRAMLANPILHIPIEENQLGITALLVIMSNFHYGLIVVIRDPDDVQDIGIDDIGKQISSQFAEHMPHWVGRYFERMQGTILKFASFEEGTTYGYIILDFNEFHFISLSETPTLEGSSAHDQYLFIAPTDVSFGEFVGESGFLN